MEKKRRVQRGRHGGHRRPQHTCFWLFISGWVPDTSYSFSLVPLMHHFHLKIQNTSGPQTRQSIQQPQILGLFTHLFIYPSPHLSSPYHLPLSAISGSIYVSLIYHLSLSAIYPSIHLSIISLLTISMLPMCLCTYVPIYRLSVNDLHLLSMCLSTYVPWYLSPVYSSSVLILFILFLV